MPQKSPTQDLHVFFSHMLLHRVNYYAILIALKGKMSCDTPKDNHKKGTRNE